MLLSKNLCNHSKRYFCFQHPACNRTSKAVKTFLFIS